MSATSQGDDAATIRRGVFQALGLALALAAALAVMWWLRSLILLLFAAILLAILLRSLSRPFVRWLHLGPRAGVLIVVLLALFGLTLFAGLLGNRVLSEITSLTQQLPNALADFGNWLGLADIEAWIAQNLQGQMDAMSLIGELSGATMWMINGLIGFLLVVSGGLFIALNPRTYETGFLALVPPKPRPRAQQVLHDLGRALKYWLLGQLVAMICVAIPTAIGLVLLDVPTPYALAFLAGLLEFIPYVGPVLSAIPAIAVAFAESPLAAVWVGLLYFGVQQLEAVLLIPVIQRQTVNLPPAVTVFSVVAFGVVLGPMGVVLGAPLTVVAITLLRNLWSDPDAAS